MDSATVFGKWMPPRLSCLLTIHTSSTKWSDGDTKIPENESSSMYRSQLLLGFSAHEGTSIKFRWQVPSEGAVLISIK